MIRRQVTIVNKLGLHARAAAKFVTLASSFDSEVQLARGERLVNGKSIMGVMMLAAAKGVSLELIIDGGDEAEALDKLEQLILDRFGEPE
ncbi:MAG: HPr family phosphocarrier protein [Gammaproteobacteria bacterium]